MITCHVYKVFYCRHVFYKCSYGTKLFNVSLPTFRIYIPFFRIRTNTGIVDGNVPCNVLKCMFPFERKASSFQILTNSMTYGTEGSMSHSQELSSNPFSEPNQRNSLFYLRYLLALSSHLRLGLPKGVSPEPNQPNSLFYLRYLLTLSSHLFIHISREIFPIDLGRSEERFSRNAES